MVAPALVGSPIPHTVFSVNLIRWSRPELNPHSAKTRDMTGPIAVEPKMGRAIKTVKCRAYTTKAGYERLADVMTLAQRLHNGALEHRKTAYKQEHKSITFNQQVKEFTLIRGDDSEYAGINRRLMIDSSLRRLDTAFQSFFRRVKAGQTPGYPRFKARHVFQTLSASYVEPQWYKPQPNGKLWLQINGLPRIEIPDTSRIPEGKPLSLTITMKHHKLWVSMAYEFTPEPLESTGAIVGIDRGVKKLLADSNGVMEPPFSPDRKKRRRLQRAMVRKRHGRGIKASRRYKTGQGVPMPDS